MHAAVRNRLDRDRHIKEGFYYIHILHSFTGEREQQETGSKKRKKNANVKALGNKDIKKEIEGEQEARGNEVGKSKVV